MNTTTSLQIRTDMARTMGQKAEAMRREAMDEVLRYEGALGCLKQMDQALAMEAAAIKDQTQAGDASVEDAQWQMKGITSAQKCATDLHDRAVVHLASLRGRVAQAEKTLDMLEALFTADIQAAQRLVDHPPEAPEGHSGQHPGPSLAEQRRADEVVAEATVDVPTDDQPSLSSASANLAP